MGRIVSLIKRKAAKVAIAAVALTVALLPSLALATPVPEVLTADISTYFDYTTSTQNLVTAVISFMSVVFAGVFAILAMFSLVRHFFGRKRAGIGG